MFIDTLHEYSNTIIMTWKNRLYFSVYLIVVMLLSLKQSINIRLQLAVQLISCNNYIKHGHIISDKIPVAMPIKLVTANSHPVNMLHWYFK